MSFRFKKRRKQKQWARVQIRYIKNLYCDDLTRATFYHLKSVIRFPKRLLEGNWNYK